MVEQSLNLDAIFSSLSDPTRRDILSRIRERSLSISAIAEHYEISFAGVAKHLEVLERAGLIRKSRRGKERLVEVDPQALVAARDYLENYQQLWTQRLDSLDRYITATKPEGTHHDAH